MADDIPKSRRRHSARILYLSLLFAGCTTVTYQSNLPPGAAKPPGYPIPLYSQEMKVPRPCEVIGTMSIEAGSYTVSGGSFATELKTVMRRAREMGADAVKLTAVVKPSFTNPNSSLKADLLRYTDVWETVAMSPSDFQAYLDANQQELDPLEGIWISSGPNLHSIGIMKNKAKPGRDFVGFILESGNPVWPAGAKKMAIHRGVKPGSYGVTYYLDDFEPCGISLILGQKRVFVITIQKMDAEDAIIILYSKK